MTKSSFSLLLRFFSSTLLFGCLGIGRGNAFAKASKPPDIIAIAPDRSTAYPNGLHNGLWLSAKRLNITMTIWDVGNFDAEKSYQVLQQAIDLPAEEQPKVYCIWPVDFPSRDLMKELYNKHRVPIIQMNQLPGADTQWEWGHLAGYAGPDDTLRARNAGIMLIEAFATSEETTNVVGLGYPASYGGYGLSMDAFAASLEGSSVDLIRRLPLDWGTQPAYEATLALMDEFATTSGVNAMNGKEILHGIYAMDDNILLGIYQALVDLGIKPGEDIIVVGTVCNGARELLKDSIQYGTTVQAPVLEGKLAIGMAAEYIEQGYLTGDNETNVIRFTPNPPTTSATWEDMFVEFLGESSTVDELCTWSLFYERVAGPTSVEVTEDICDIVRCEYIPKGLFVVGYALVATNFGLAAVAAVLLYMYREKKIIGIAQPFFLALVIVGSMVDTSSIIFMSRDNRDYSDEALDRACVSWVTLLSIGHMMTTATLAAKIFRVKRLVDAGLNVRRVQITVAQVSWFIVLFVGLDAIVLTVWFVTDPYQWVVKSSSDDLNGYVNEAVGECDSEGDNYWVYPLLIALLHVAVLIYANWLAYATSKYHNISDSKAVAICLFNSIQLLLIGAPILALVGGNVATSYLIRICFVFLNNFGVLVIIVLPKLFKCMIGHGNDLPQLALTEISRKSRGDGLPGSGEKSSGNASGDGGKTDHALQTRRPPGVKKSFDDDDEDCDPERMEDEPEQAPLSRHSGDARSRHVSFAPAQSIEEEPTFMNAAVHSAIATNQKKQNQKKAVKNDTMRDVLGSTGWSEAEGVLATKGNQVQSGNFSKNALMKWVSNASSVNNESKASYIEPVPEDQQSLGGESGSGGNSRGSGSAGAGSRDSGSTAKPKDGKVSPHSVLDVMWRGRGYSRNLYSVLETAYYNQPTPLQLASFKESILELVQQGDKNQLQSLLRTPGMSQNPSDPNGVTLIHEICRVGDVSMLNMVLDEFGGDSEESKLKLVQIADSTGRTPLHFACMASNGEQGDSSTDLSVPIAEITASKGSGNDLGEKPRFAIVEVLTSMDRRLFSMKDKNGKTPLDLVPKEQWSAWQDFLYLVRDKYWPRRLVRADGEEHAPLLTLEKPHSRPLPEPSASAN